MSAELLMQIAGCGAFLLTVYWVRGRELREKYAILWLLVATVLLICGLFPELIMMLAEYAHLGYASAVLFISLIAVYVFSFAVSVSLSRQHRNSIRLMQEVALLEQRLRNLEQESALRRWVGAKGEEEEPFGDSSLAA
jgi:hypothetical protein